MADSAEPDPRPFIVRLGQSGMMLLIGGVIGLACGFLPLASSEAVAAKVPDLGGLGLDLGNIGNMLGGAGSAPKTIKVIDDYRGLSCLGGYLAALYFALRLYSPTGPVPTNQCWLAIIVCASTFFTAIWIIASPPGGGLGGLDLGGGPMKLRLGALANVFPASLITSGAFLKAKEERLV